MPVFLSSAISTVVSFGVIWPLIYIRHDTWYSPQEIIELICEEGNDVDKEDSHDGDWPGITNQTTISKYMKLFVFMFLVTNSKFNY